MKSPPALRSSIDSNKRKKKTMNPKTGRRTLLFFIPYTMERKKSDNSDNSPKIPIPVNVSRY
jgi:hypothetical protein